MRQILLLLLSMAFFSLIAQKNDKLIVDAGTLIDDADKAYNEGEIKKADSLYSFAMSKKLNKENSIRLAENYASLLINNGQFDSAHAVFTFGILADTMNDRLWFLRGELSGKFMRKADWAATDISKAIELNANNELYYESRALAFDAMKNYPAAERDYSQLIELSDSPRNYTSRAMFFLRREKLPQALDDANKAIEKDELYTWSYIVKGQVYLKQKNTELACEAFLKAEEMGNDSKELTQYLSYCLHDKTDD